MIIWIIILAHLLVVDDLMSIFEVPQQGSNILVSGTLLILLVWPISLSLGIVYTCMLGLVTIYAMIRKL